MYQHILIATDGSDLANKGVERGLALAAPLKAKVYFIVVTEPWAPGFDEAVAWNPNSKVLDDYRKANDDVAQKILDAAKAQAKALSVESEGIHVADRYAADAIIETAKEKNADMIVMASHGRKGLGRLLLGSQTQMVLAHSKTPILVIR